MPTASFRVYQPVTHLLSAADAGELKEWVTNSLQAGAKILLLDLSNVLFMDSRGLAVLIMAHKQARQMNSVLALCSAQEQVLMVLRLSNLTELFPLYESVEDYQRVSANY
ncbi:MAG: STAS domain-containing protein [Cyanobacteria bacterium P01_F01_bin.150]